VKLNVRTFTSTTRDVTTWTTCYGNIRYRENIYHGINLLHPNIPITCLKYLIFSDLSPLLANIFMFLYSNVSRFNLVIDHVIVVQKFLHH